jgi:hypothetical protein
MEGDGSIRRDPGLFVPGEEEDAVGRRVQRQRTTRFSSGRNTKVSLNPMGGGVSSVVTRPASFRLVSEAGGERWSGGVGRREEAREVLAGRKVKIGRAVIEPGSLDVSAAVRDEGSS